VNVAIVAAMFLWAAKKDGEHDRNAAPPRHPLADALGPE
jgi:hypothetical protein